MTLEQVQPHPFKRVIAELDTSRLDHAKQARASLTRQLQEGAHWLAVTDGPCSRSLRRVCAGRESPSAPTLRGEQPPEQPNETAVLRDIVFRMSAQEKKPPELPGGPEDAVNLRLSALSGRSREVLEVLARQKDRRPDRFYEGALRALADRTNPVRAEMAAYALRELIQELERAASAPKKGSGLGVLLRAFRPKWEAAARRASDRGLVDRCDPAVFAVDRFLEDARKGHLSRRDRAQATLSGLDPVQRVGPPDIEKGRIEALLEFREEFDRVLHGERPTDAEVFALLVERFETFLLAWFQPRTFEDFSEIDELLEEGPPT